MKLLRTRMKLSRRRMNVLRTRIQILVLETFILLLETFILVLKTFILVLQLAEKYTNFFQILRKLSIPYSILYGILYSKDLVYFSANCRTRMKVSRRRMKVSRTRIQILVLKTFILFLETFIPVLSRLSFLSCSQQKTILNLYYKVYHRVYYKECLISFKSALLSLGESAF